MEHIRITTLKINQTVVHIGKVSTLFSYDTPICTKTPKGIVLHPSWAYSRTTSKYRSQFLGETTRETRKKLVAGEYTISHLDKELYNA